MAIAVEMPKMSDTMEEGLLVSWLVDEGAKVKSGDVVAQVETDKATMDLEVFDDGVLLKKVAQEGDSIPIGGLIAILGKAEEDISALLGKYGSSDGVSTPEPAAPTVSVDAAATEFDSTVAATSTGDGRIKVSPLARKIAEDKGIDLHSVAGTGPEGRIIKRDVESTAPVTKAPQPVATQPVAQPTTPVKVATPAPTPAGQYRSEKITPMRRTIARRLSESKFTAPHFYLQVDVDMEKCIAFRQELNKVAEARGMAKVSFNDIITKACGVALRQHPAMNASYLENEGEIRSYDYAHVAVAVAIDEGLVTPVIRNADQKGLSQIAAETQDFATRARNRQLEPADWEGSTFTTSNLGMFGIERFTAIINPPNAGILAIGAIRDEAVVKEGAVVAGKRMALTLSCDHRVVDGAVGAKYLSTLKQFLEEPTLLML